MNVISMLRLLTLNTVCSSKKQKRELRSTQLVLCRNAGTFNPCHSEYFNVLHSFPNCYPVNLQHSIRKHVFSIGVENNVDPDQMASLEANRSGSTMF